MSDGPSYTFAVEKAEGGHQWVMQEDGEVVVTSETFVDAYRFSHEDKERMAAQRVEDKPITTERSHLVASSEELATSAMEEAQKGHVANQEALRAAEARESRLRRSEILKGVPGVRDAGD